MKIPISEARRRLPELVRRVRRNSEVIFQITVNNEVAAELCAPERAPEPGAAGRALLDIIEKLPKSRGRKTRTSSRIKNHLYGRKGSIR